MSKLNKKLSIIIPVYNEKYTIQKLLNKIYKLRNLKKEIIVINDASTDGTKEILNSIEMPFEILNIIVEPNKNLKITKTVRL